MPIEGEQEDLGCDFHSVKRSLTEELRNAVNLRTETG